MTDLIKFVSQWCANFKADKCAGLSITDSGSVVRMSKPNDPCVLFSTGARCSYFEECVAPGVDRCDNNTFAQRKYKEIGNEALRQYRLATNVASVQINGKRKCPDCGKPLLPRKRYCVTCSETRKLSANRKRAVMST